MSGTLILTKEINSNQEKVVVSGENLKPGMYIYTLIVNGKEIDSKRMILSK